MKNNDCFEATGSSPNHLKFLFLHLEFRTLAFRYTMERGKADNRIWKTQIACKSLELRNPQGSSASSCKKNRTEHIEEDEIGRTPD